MTGLQWTAHPQLRDPILVAAFTGWNDAGDAASDAVAWLAAHHTARPFASIDPDEHYDFQANRPDVELVDGVTRRISWPTLEFAAAPATDDGPDLVLLSGPEPNLRWRGVLRHGAGGRARHRLPDRRDLRRAARRHAALLAHPRHREHDRPDEDGASSGWSRRATRARPGSSACCTTRAATRASRRRRSGRRSRTTSRRHRTRRRRARCSTSSRPSPAGPWTCASSASPPRRGARGSTSAVAGDDEMRDYVRAFEEQRDDSTGAIPGDDAIDEIPSGDDLAEAFEEYLREQGLE